MGKSSFSINVYLTTSKLLGYIIFITGSIFAFMYKDPNIFIFSSSISAGLLGLKTWQSAALEKKKLEFPDGSGGINGSDVGSSSSTITTTTSSDITTSGNVQKPPEEIG